MAIKLIASDLDGTLLDSHHFIPAGNLNAINSINEKNIDFAICTGKTYSMTKDICKECNASYGIFGNGTQIINLKTGKEIYHNLLSFDNFEICYNIAKNYNLHMHLYSDKEIVSQELLYMDLRNYILNNQNPSSELSFRITDNIYDFVLNNNTSIFKLVISSLNDLSSIKNEILNKADVSINLIRKKGNYKDQIINKEYEYLDIAPKQNGKAYALNFLSNFLNVESENILAIGDNINDIDMIKQSGIGVTLADSYEEVKKVANYTTKNSCSNSGFASNL